MSRIIDLRDAKIYQNGPAIGRNFYIGGFDVAVDNRRILVMEKGKCVTNLDYIRYDRFFLEGKIVVRCQALLQVLTIHVVHHQVLVRAKGEKICKLYQVRMGKPRKNRSLRIELRDRGWLVIPVFLDGTGLVQSSIPGAVHGSKSAMGQELENLVTVVKDGVGGKENKGLLYEKLQDLRWDTGKSCLLAGEYPVVTVYYVVCPVRLTIQSNRFVT